MIAARMNMAANFSRSIARPRMGRKYHDGGFHVKWFAFVAFLD